MSAESQLKKLGLVLPKPHVPLANYVPVRRDGHTLYIGGQGPARPDGTFQTGKVGLSVTAEEGYQHARLSALGLLSLAQSAAGSLENIEIMKILGLVNATPDFDRHPFVLNGCSDLLVEVLGERGRHARTAVGVASLPGNITVEIEAVVRILDTNAA
jgi:enamine deaminase RidA (YjgF/YER057c/UK114 family)